MFAIYLLKVYSTQQEVITASVNKSDYTVSGSGERRKSPHVTSTFLSEVALMANHAPLSGLSLIIYKKARYYHCSIELTDLHFDAARNISYYFLKGQEDFNKKSPIFMLFILLFSR